jgi:hypothetical protein
MRCAERGHNPSRFTFFSEEPYYRATHSRLEPVKTFAYTVADHWHGILAFFGLLATWGG